MIAPHAAATANTDAYDPALDDDDVLRARVRRIVGPALTGQGWAALTVAERQRMRALMRDIVAWDRA